MFTNDGYINSQSLTSKIPYGRQMSDENGCGWIAVFNILRHLETNPPQAEEVAKAMSGGVILGGYLGTWPFAIVRFLRRRGYAVTWSVRKTRLQKIAEQSEASIYLYCGPWSGLLHWRDLGAHYVMIHPRNDGGFRTLNYGSDSHAMPIHSLLGPHAHYPLTLMIGVQRRRHRG